MRNFILHSEAVRGFLYAWDWFVIDFNVFLSKLSTKVLILKKEDMMTYNEGVLTVLCLQVVFILQNII